MEGPQEGSAAEPPINSARGPLRMTTESSAIDPQSAEAYHRVRFAFDPKRAKAWRPLCGYLQRWVDRERPLLELGAGYGEFSHFIEAGEKAALDLNSDLVPHWAEGVRPIIQSALEPWPIEDGSLGTVFASNFFEHFTLEDGGAILAQALEKLAPGGRLIVVQPNFRLEPRRYFDDYTHKQIYTDESFADFLAASGFEIERRENRFTPFTMKGRVPVAEWLVRLYLASPVRPLAGQFMIVARKQARG